MRELLTRGVGVVGALIGTALLLAAPVLAVEGDTVADAVLGQPDFSSRACPDNFISGLSAEILCGPTAIAMDPTSGRLFVADGNSRVLSWANTHRLTNGEPADLILGQPDFTTGGCQFGLFAQVTLCSARGIAVDRLGRVYVSDRDNGRVVRYSPPFELGQLPDLVLGQPDLHSSPQFGRSGSCDVPDPTRSMCLPIGVAIDGAGRLYVADAQLNRVLRFTVPTTTFQAADLVIGQASLIMPSQGCPEVPVENEICLPLALAVDRQGNVYVADGFQRVLRFPQPETNGSLPNLVLGKPIPLGCSAEVSARTLCAPAGFMVDSSGRLYVSDAGHNRVLRYDHLSVNGQAADLVIGQVSFTSGECNAGGLSAASLCEPRGLTVDFRGDLFVADFSNNRVLRYDQPSNGTQPPTGTRSVGVP